MRLSTRTALSWVEHPIYTQMIYCLDRVSVLADRSPNSEGIEPFKTVLSGDREAMAKLSMHDLATVLAATLTGMPVEEFEADVNNWLETAKHPRWKRPYTDLTFQPMLDVLQYLRDNGFKTYIVTGGGQDFVRVYSRAGLWHPSRTGGRQPWAARSSATIRMASHS